MKMAVRLLRKQQKKLSRRQTPIWQNKRNICIPYLFLTPSLLGVAVFVLFPFADVVKRSFTDAMGNQFVGLHNYTEVLQNQAFQMAVKNTGRFLLTCIPLLLLLSFVCALVIQALTKGKGFWKLTFLFPLAIPIASVVLVWKLFLADTGYLNQIAAFLGAGTLHWMEDKAIFAVLVFTYIWKNMGYDIVLWTAGLGAIPMELYEAARTDGCNAWQCFRYVTLPGIQSTIFVTAVLSLVNAFRVFREAYLIAGDYPQERIYMLQHLFNNWFVSLDIQKMSAGAVMMTVVLSMVILLWRRVGKEV